jgi:drug/metabolite transporter (DMT)-like permease
MAFAVASTAGRGRSNERPASSRQRRLMLLIGLLDASAYTAFCLGFFACGAVVSSLVLSSASQVLTALSTRFLLGRRLTRGQAAGVACICAGLLVRAAPSGKAGAAAAAAVVQPGFATGVMLVLLAALLYTLLGVAYDKLVRSSEAAPSHTTVMWYTSMLGALPQQLQLGAAAAAG